MMGGGRAQDPVWQALQPSRLTAVVDIGANPIGNPSRYRHMLADGLCTVTGFEPQADALEKLNALKTPLETYLPFAVGDGADHTLHVCRGRGLSSLLEPDDRRMATFRALGDWCGVTEKVPLSTRRLDDIAEIAAIDLLKIDTQGSELMIFRNGRETLRKALAVHVELNFFPIYKNQPTLADVDGELRAQGFVPHALAELNRVAIAPMVIDRPPGRPLNQIVDADFVYVRDFVDWSGFETEQLKHLALIAHHIYASVDLAWAAIRELSRRGAIDPGFQQSYLPLAQERITKRLDQIKRRTDV